MRTRAASDVHNTSIVSTSSSTKEYADRPSHVVFFPKFMIRPHAKQQQQLGVAVGAEQSIRIGGRWTNIYASGSVPVSDSILASEQDYFTISGGKNSNGKYQVVWSTKMQLFHLANFLGITVQRVTDFVYILDIEIFHDYEFLFEAHQTTALLDMHSHSNLDWKNTTDMRYPLAVGHHRIKVELKRRDDSFGAILSHRQKTLTYKVTKAIQYRPIDIDPELFQKTHETKVPPRMTKETVHAPKPRARPGTAPALAPAPAPMALNVDLFPTGYSFEHLEDVLNSFDRGSVPLGGVQRRFAMAEIDEDGWETLRHLIIAVAGDNKIRRNRQETRN